jgi:hypothetical protein
MTSIKNLSELINRFDEICEIAQQEDVIINFNNLNEGVALISLSKLKQIQEIEKSFQQMLQVLQINRIRDNAEPGGTWEEFLNLIDDGLSSDSVDLPVDQVFVKIAAGKKIEI